MTADHSPLGVESGSAPLVRISLLAPGLSQLGFAQQNGLSWVARPLRPYELPWKGLWGPSKDGRR